MRLLLGSAATLALLLATTVVAAAQDDRCPTKRMVVAGTTVENGAVTVTIQAHGYCNLATALIDSWALANDEIMNASKQHGVALPSRLQFTGDKNVQPPEQKPSVIIRPQLPEGLKMVSEIK
jgi:hypothetical protein